MDVTPSGMTIDVKEVHPRNALEPMDVTPSSNITCVREDLLRYQGVYDWKSIPDEEHEFL